MNAYYKVTQDLYTLFSNDEEINTVDKGDITMVDIDDKTIFPLAHLNVYSAGLNLNTSLLEFDVNLMVMNLRDQRNENETDKFIGNDNEDDNLNAMLMVIYRSFKKLEKETEISDLYLVSYERPEPFTEKRNNVVDGWSWRFTVGVKVDEISAC